ncbi:hypothetical protein A3J23_01625 [Candidatus Peregrinibacteria bacterium RIFCSPLOWO2_02_FULL_48_14]|nr:MAG: hypothetical protein A2974_03300 [Candidatus Peregrinibacteria bacterium RIFCSPLOWO2_01_FULL_48_20]OGJ45289.1 MAG: hypothetical protein A3J23_01625 [Candidatus Peregrinibacteria bacterium RIFCSPLOWO2_02_FULL_48_14]
MIEGGPSVHIYYPGGTFRPVVDSFRRRINQNGEGPFWVDEKVDMDLRVKENPVLSRVLLGVFSYNDLDVLSELCRRSVVTCVATQERFLPDLQECLRQPDCSAHRVVGIRKGFSISPDVLKRTTETLLNWDGRTASLSQVVPALSSDWPIRAKRFTPMSEGYSEGFALWLRNRNAIPRRQS